MAYIRFLETTLNWDPVRKAKDIVDSVKRVLLEVGQWWVRDILAGHFQPTAIAKYGYHPRSRAYMKRRAPVGGERRPLVWTGAFYVAAKAGRLSTPKRGKDVTVKLLFRGGFTNRKTGRNVRSDLFAKSSSEEDFIQHHVWMGCLRFLRKPEMAMKPVSRMGA